MYWNTQYQGMELLWNCISVSIDTPGPAVRHGLATAQAGLKVRLLHDVGGSIARVLRET